MNNQKLTTKYILVGTIAVLFTWVFHEFAHWLTSELFGYETMMTLNGTSTINGQHPTDIHKNIISASGPIITILQGLVVVLLLNSKGWNKYFYPFLFVPFYMRLLAGLMNFINPNDEGRISAFMQIGTFTLPIIVSGLLFLMVYKISRRYNLNWKFQLGTTLITMISSSILILVDQFFGIRLL